MPALSKYNSDYHDDWAWSLAIKGATNEEIAEAFGVSTRTIIRWMKEYESFGEAVEHGKNIADAKVERSLYKRATGYEITETEKTIDMDKDGNPKPVRIKSVTKQIAPDTMAIMYWLNNRKRVHWSQRQELTVSAGDDSEDVVVYLPAIDGENDGQSTD